MKRLLAVLSASFVFGLFGCKQGVDGNSIVAKLRQPSFSSNAGPAYIAECRAAGVPVPNTVLDVNDGWVNHGVLANPFLEPEKAAELWSWVSSSPLGLCLALPRWEVAGANRERAHLFGVICQGFESSSPDDSSGRV